jgi:hypothetical protein
MVPCETDPRRFPPPWSAFVVKDSTGQQLAYVYFEEEPGRIGKLY